MRTESTPLDVKTSGTGYGATNYAMKHWLYKYLQISGTWSGSTFGIEVSLDGTNFDEILELTDVSDTFQAIAPTCFAMRVNTKTVGSITSIAMILCGSNARAD
jgi:hypothetical protein